MRKLITKPFRRWARKNGLKDQKLREAIDDLESGKSTACLGQNLYKVRVSKEGKGKSGGYRTIIVFKKDFRAVFLLGFGKNEKDNLEEDEENYLKELGKTLLNLSPDEINKNIRSGVLFDIGEEKK